MEKIFSRGKTAERVIIFRAKPVATIYFAAPASSSLGGAREESNVGLRFGGLAARGRRGRITPGRMPPSSSGLGRSPLTAKTGVRVPLGVVGSVSGIRSCDRFFQG